MIKRRTLFLWLVLSLVSARCGAGSSPFTLTSPTLPIAMNPPTSNPRPIQTLSIDCGLQLRGYQCTAHAVYADGGAASVTEFARWATGDPGIATVDTDGFLTVHRAGEAWISATYQGVMATLSMYLQVRDQGAH